MNAAALLSAILAGAGLLVEVVNLRYFKAIRPAAGNAPRTIACVAMRNEEANAQQCLNGLLAQPDIALIVVADDGSDDRTREIVSAIASGNGRVFLIECGAQGAGSKSAALAAAAAHAVRCDPELLLFTDADVVLKAGALAGLHDAMAGSGADAVSAWPRVDAQSLWDAMFAPLVTLLLIQALPMWIRTPDPRFAAGNGQMFLVNAAAYERSGGHARISHSVEDVALAKAIARSGSRMVLGSAAAVATVRGYGGLRENVLGLGRSLYVSAGVPGCAAFAFWQFFAFAFPWMAIVKAPSAALCAVACSLAARVLLALRMHERTCFALAAPGAGVAGAFGALTAAWLGNRGALTWRGRSCA